MAVLEAIPEAVREATRQRSSERDISAALLEDRARREREVRRRRADGILAPARARPAAEAPPLAATARRVSGSPARKPVPQRSEQITRARPATAARTGTVSGPKTAVKSWLPHEISADAWPEQVLTLDVVSPSDGPVALACAHANGEISVRSAHNGELLARQHVHDAPIWALAWGPRFGIVSAARTLSSDVA